MGNVEEALREDFVRWRQERGKTEINTIEEDVSEFMKDTYQIPSEEVNLLDVVNTMVADVIFVTAVTAGGSVNFFASGVNFSILTHFFVFFLTKTVEIR